MADNTNVEDLSYREASVELEKIIRALEENDLELEESLEKYARAVELVKSLRARLASAEQQVKVLMRDAGGEDVLVEGEPASEDDTRLS